MKLIGKDTRYLKTCRNTNENHKNSKWTMQKHGLIQMIQEHKTGHVDNKLLQKLFRNLVFPRIASNGRGNKTNLSMQ